MTPTTPARGTGRGTGPSPRGSGTTDTAVRERVGHVPVPPRTWPDAETLRSDGFAPIEAYAAIGDRRSVALVAADGAVDWWALPTLDAPPVFDALLDPHGGGHVVLAPQGPARVERRYVEGTNVLETTFTTPDGVVRVTDSCNLGESGQLPWSEMGRRVEALAGAVPMHWEVNAGNRFASAKPWVRRRGDTPVVRLADQSIGVLCEGVGDAEVAGSRVHGRFVAREGSRHLLGLVSTDAEPLFLPPTRAVDRRIDSTIGWWQRWNDQRVAGYGGRWQAAVRRSALSLHLLVAAHSGAIAAAPTTSLPELPGGGRNFDYRFAWIRDMSFTIVAMARLGLGEEVHRSLSWLLSTIRQTEPSIHVFYSLDGRIVEGEHEVPVPGYRHSLPVRSGNRAADQKQLENYGALLDAVWVYVADGHDLDDRSADVVARCADRVCDFWRTPDCGLWELTDVRHYTSSKVGCWTALDRACRLADAGQVPTRNRGRWALERGEIVDWVRAHCWSEAKSAYTFHAGTDALDAAVLLMARHGFDRGERLASTVDAIRRELGRGPLVYRYSGMEDQEGAFLACSFWLAEALACTGQVEEAAGLMDQLVDLANDVGLFSEEMDPRTGEQWGNFPQALTHLALVNAAVMIDDRLDRR